MNTKCTREDYNHAFDIGFLARESNMAVGTNPFDVSVQPECHEAWLDGWSAIDNVSGEGC